VLKRREEAKLALAVLSWRGDVLAAQEGRDYVTVELVNDAG
jgi:hypothetical protein